MNGTLDKIRVQFDYLPLINFAMQQNKVSVIHQLSIENMTSEPFRNIQVQITAEPDFGSITPVMMEAIPANNSVCLQSFSLVLSANYFAQLTERMSGSLKIEIRSEAETIFTRTYPHRHSGIRPMGRNQYIPRDAGSVHHPQSCRAHSYYQESRRHSGTVDRYSVTGRIPKPQSGPCEKADGSHLHRSYRTANYLQHHSRQLRRARTACPV